MSEPNERTEASTRTVLHVLPHPGGGAQTYVDALAAMDGYAFESVYLATGPRPARALPSILRNWVRIQRRGRASDVVHVHGEVASTLCLPALMAHPSVVTFHGLHLLRRLDGPGRRAAELNLRMLVRAASRSICVSESEYADVLNVAGREMDGRIELVPNGIQPFPAATRDERARARAAFGLTDQTTVGAWLAGLNTHKDPLLAARAAIEVGDETDFVLLVAGDGPLRPELERLAAGEGGTAVRVLGHRQDAKEVLAAADLFVLSSQREGLSLSLLEAMSMALPPVVSDVPGNIDAVGDAGVVVSFGDVHGFASAIRRLVTDESTRLSLGARARERVTERFSADEMVQRTRAVYDAVVGAERLG